MLQGHIIVPNRFDLKNKGQSYSLYPFAPFCLSKTMHHIPMVKIRFYSYDGFIVKEVLRG